MRGTIPLLLASLPAARACARPDPVVLPPRLGSGISQRRRDHPRWACPMRTLAAGILLAATSAVAAPAPRNGNKYDFTDHQPTHAGVVRREHRAGVEASPSQVKRNARTVQQLDRKLLREEAVPLPRDPVSLTPP